MPGTMLRGAVDHEFVGVHRQRVGAAGRAWLRTILGRARVAGLADSDADIDVAVLMLTAPGNVGALAIANTASGTHVGIAIESAYRAHGELEARDRMVDAGPSLT